MFQTKGFDSTEGKLDSLCAAGFDVKKLTEDGSFEGYASVFNIKDNGNDIVMPGAFTKSLKTKGADKIKMLWQHKWDSPTGVWEVVKEDDKGLYVKGRLLQEIKAGQEALAMMRAGVIDSLSIGFRTKKAKYDEKTGTRSLLELELWEISLVTFPMLAQAKINAVKGSFDERGIEAALREAGLSKEFAKNVVLHGVKRAAIMSGDRREAGNGDLLKQIQSVTAALRSHL